MSGPARPRSVRAERDYQETPPEPVAIELVTGAQLLPSRTTIQEAKDMTQWYAHLACDADARTRHSDRRELAARIGITYPTPAALAAA